MEDLYIRDCERVLGQRCCPNPECRGHIFFTYDHLNRTLLTIYPAAKIRFSSENVPEQVVESMEEATSSLAHGNLRAAAVMIRRAVEEICDEQGCAAEDAKGRPIELYHRIEELKGKVTLPPKLFDGMHNLRMLGNSGAHIKSKAYANVGEPEVRAAMKFSFRIIEALYQFENLVSELDALKQPSTD